MNGPQVSILIPVFNRENYIAECIQSALNQTFSDFEIVIVDNASEDGTWEICQKYAASDSRIRLFRNAKNLGPVRNWLACVEQATGLYVKILWSDDLIHPEFIEKLLPYLDDDDVAFAYSSARLFSDEKINFNESTIFGIGRSGMSTGIYDSSIYISGALLDGGLNEGLFPVSPGCALFRAQDVRENLLLHVPNRVGSDFSMHAIGNDLLLFLLTAQAYKKFAFYNQDLSCFRVHSNSITVSSLSGKIPLHYDLAKGFFSEGYITDNAISKKLNSVFLVHFIRYRTHDFGIKALHDFYPTISSFDIDLVYFIKIAVKRVYNKIRSIHSQ